MKKSVTSRDIELIRQMIRKRVSYEALSVDYRNCKSKLDEIIELMVEVYVMESDVKIRGKVVPYQLFRKRLDSYDQFTMEYVLGSLTENRSKVGNMKKYLLATIYNAPATQSNHMFSELQSSGII